MKKVKQILNFPRKWIRDIYDWTIKWAESKYSLVALFTVAVMESAFFPVPVDVLMIPIAVGKPKRSFWFAGITLIGSVLGAYLGYLIGYSFYNSVGEAIFETYGLTEFVSTVTEKYNDNAFLAILGAGFTPIPFKVFTIVAGIANVNLLTLTLAAILGRGGRFFLVAGLIRVFGERIKDSIEKYFDFFSLLFLLLLIGGFLVVKFV